jgi:predicted nucleic acid-binding protein
MAQAAAAALMRWLGERRFLQAFPILPVEDAVATTPDGMTVERERPAADRLIAAIAEVSNEVPVTRNVADLVGAGVDTGDPRAIAK